MELAARQLSPHHIRLLPAQQSILQMQIMKTGIAEACVIPLEYIQEGIQPMPYQTIYLEIGEISCEIKVGEIMDGIHMGEDIQMEEKQIYRFSNTGLALGIFLAPFSLI